jgi:hypothetical protein
LRQWLKTNPDNEALHEADMSSPNRSRTMSENNKTIDNTTVQQKESPFTRRITFKDSSLALKTFNTIDKGFFNIIVQVCAILNIKYKDNFTQSSSASIICWDGNEKPEK